MTRQEQIDSAASKQHCDASERGFKRGAKWADEHPSADTLYRAVELYHLWQASTDELKLTPLQFAIKHWDDPNTFIESII